MKKWHYALIFWIFIAFLNMGVFWAGYKIGKTPTTIDKEYRQDQFSLQTDYNQLYLLCEQKYQLAVRGDLENATRVNGRMDQLSQDIKDLKQKYGQ